MSRIADTTGTVVRLGTPGRARKAAGVTALVIVAGTIAAACGSGPAAAPKASQPNSAVSTRSGTPEKAVLAINSTRPVAKPVTKPVAKVTPKPPVRPVHTPPVKPKPALSGDILSATALGPIQFGMTVSQAEAAGGVDISQHYWSGPECQIGQSTSLPGVEFNIDPRTDTILAVMVTTAAAGIETTAGIGLGDKVSKLEATYGKSLRVLTDFYNGNGTTDVDSGVPAAYSLESGQASVVFMMVYEKATAAAESVNQLVAGDFADGMSFC